MYGEDKEFGVPSQIKTMFSLDTQLWLISAENHTGLELKFWQICRGRYLFDTFDPIKIRQSWYERGSGATCKLLKLRHRPGLICNCVSWLDMMRTSLNIFVLTTVINLWFLG